MIEWTLFITRKIDNFKGRGKIIMKKWVTPRASQEDFVANNAVSTCWKVACDTEAAQQVERGPFPYHNPKHCGNPDNQVIVTDKNGNVTGLKEINSDFGQGGQLNCTIYTDVSYSQKATPKSINDYVGKKIYWTNMATRRTFHHQGTVNLTEATHPQMS